MVDIFALAVSHGLLALAVWRLLWRDDLYHDPGTRPERTVHAMRVDPIDARSGEGAEGGTGDSDA